MKNVILMITFLFILPIYANSQSKNEDKDEGVEEISAIIIESHKFAIVQKEEYVQQLLWDGKDIGVESQYLSFKHYFHSEIEDVILVELCSGGSGCPYEHILISNVGETEIKISEAFGYCILPAVITESNETI